MTVEGETDRQIWERVTAKSMDLCSSLHYRCHALTQRTEEARLWWPGRSKARPAEAVTGDQGTN